MRDYYAILGVSGTASPVEIRRAYRSLARQYSPDVNLWDEGAGVLFAEIAEAYRVLADASARTLYDRRAEDAGPAAPAGPEDRPRGRRGDDLSVTVELGFHQAVTGIDTELPLHRMTPCGPCAATGTASTGTPEACRHCAGLGEVWSGGDAPRPQPCPLCDGTGQRVPDPCPTCRGRGVHPARAVIRVRVPPGVDTGAELRLPGEGHAGPFGGPRGDLVVITRVQEAPGFTRKGDNLHCEVMVGLVEAALGARIAVRGVDGVVELALPAGTQGGQVFRVRGRGMPRLSGGRGDLYVTARVEVPRDLEGDARALFLELGRLLPTPSRRRHPRAIA